jgi:hypothetical protein
VVSGASLNSQKVINPGSGKELFPEPTGKKAPDPGSGSATLTSTVVALHNSGAYSQCST